MSKILILNTGGTIGMKESEEGLVPEPGYLRQLMSEMTELGRAEMPAFDIIEFDSIIDSANMTPHDWLKMANRVSENYEQYDGFVVLHGTDTMAYSSSALAFMLEGLDKPVILTGAQLPLGHIRNDARENLKTAMMLAADPDIKEVGLFFGEVLLRGCRATKISATKLDAFESPNYSPIASAETNIEVFKHRLWPADPNKSLTIHPIHDSNVAMFRLFPGMSIEILTNLLQRPLRALILHTYGVGNGPANNCDFLKAIETAVANETVVVNLTQCVHGHVEPDSYATGTALSDAGAISGHDMTIEAAIAKCLFLLSRDLTYDQIRERMEWNIAGELTLPNDRRTGYSL